MKRKNSIHLSFVLLSLLLHAVATAQNWSLNHKVGTVSGVYHFAYNQTPHAIVEIYPAASPYTGFSFQWEQSTAPTAGFTPISGATQTYYSFSGPLAQTTYFRRKTTYTSNGNFIYSNVVKMSVVSINWEDRNYVREHDVKVTGVTTFQAVDQLPIGQKLQTTTYVDGLGRTVQQVSRETATPPNPNNLWGDLVQFYQYDGYGTEPVKYLPYSTTTESGKYKSSPLSEQPQYYSTNYGESYAYYSFTFDNSPLNRILNLKESGTAWATSAGKSAVYDVNDATDNVRIFTVDYVQGNPPVVGSTYPINTLYKTSYIDENGKKVVQYLNRFGQLILKKVQLDDTPTDAYNGWICTYYVYDDFGLLRYEILPEAVKYLYNNGWSFAGTNGQDVLNGYCYQYYYDDKGRVIWKKNPGVLPLNMIYDSRDRLVLAQDGNQNTLSTPQWTASLYDELDRPILSTLYNTSKSVSTLKSDVTNAPANSTITISNSTNNGGSSITITASLSPLTSSDLNTSSTTTVLKYSFYDNYSFPNVKSFNTGFTNLSAYSTSDPNVQPIITSNRTLSMATGSMTRVLESNTFLNSTVYYDDRGSLIQSLEDNIKAGTDITTLQYHFDGRLLSSCADHTTSNTGYTNYKILTKYNFDKLGRVSSIQKQFGTNAFKTVSSFEYNDIGRVKTKRLGPGYTANGGNELESLNYTYNIHGQLTGINKDYALKTPNNYSKWGHFFGMYLGYQENTFARPQLNGQISGVIWNTQGDDAQRKYDYTYDNAGRLTNADFTEQQHPGDGWANNKMDFSVGGYTGKITYDLNGNILSMLQKGVLPGTTSPIVVDDLRYTYSTYSNKLQSVTDQMSVTNANGTFGDFKDGTNGGNPDYVYDNNGNVVIDLNKNAKDLNNVAGANGIHYNFLDKPDQIRIAGKGTITITYSADGEKLERVFAPETGQATTTTYINQFIYQAVGNNPDALSFINFEEGRIRVITPTSQYNGYDQLTVDGNMDLPNGKKGVYDYFILDYQHNVRMVLSEQTHVAGNTATMETSRASIEDAVFGQVGAGNEVETTRYPASNTSWQNANIGNSVSRLGNIAGHNIGPNTLQKVMAGDAVLANVQYYYPQSASGYNPNFVNNILSSLFVSLSNGPTSTLVKGAASNITSNLGVNSSFISAVQPSTNTGSTPLAYLTVLFFDERFNLIPAQDGGVYQQQVASSVGTSGASLNLYGIKAPKNGYVFIYVSNQSDQDVYFDNLAVTISQGNIIEENHYYSFGLKIAAISSRKFQDSYDGETKNNYGMQGAFSEMDDDIGWNDFALRNYDPQIGRFVQMDPYDQFASPYVGMGNNPVLLVDPSGGVGVPCPGTSALAIFLENAVYAIGNALNSVAPIANIVGHATAFTQTGATAVTAIEFANISNGQLMTISVGSLNQNLNNSIEQDGTSQQQGAEGVQENINNQEQLKPKTIVLIFGGVDFFSTETDVSPTLLKLSNDIIAYGNQTNKRIYVSRYNTRMNGNVIFNAYEYVKKNYQPGDRVVIYGYSMGGVAGNSTSNLLSVDKISVELLVTVDAAWGWLGKAIQVPSNVKVNVNFYQTTRSLPVGSRGFPAKPQKGNNQTKIENYNWDEKMKGKGRKSHGQMDEATYNEALDRIKKAIL